MKKDRQYYQCSSCHKILRGKISFTSHTPAVYLYAHKNNGVSCPGGNRLHYGPVVESDRK
jgi:hypothetical protein